MRIIHLHKLRIPVPATSIPAAELDQARRALLELLAPLPLCGSSLTPEQRRQRGAPLALETRTIVLSTVAGLREAPQLFAEVPMTAADLEAAQDEADAARRLAACLSALAQLAQDHYLSAQAHTAAVARGLYRLALNSSRAEGLRAARLCALGVAPLYLAARSERAARAQRALRRARKAAP